jgi:hypothetical protein
VSTRLPTPDRHKGLIEAAILRPPEVTHDMVVVACGASCCDRSGREVKGTHRESDELRQSNKNAKQEDMLHPGVRAEKQLTSLVT